MKRRNELQVGASASQQRKCLQVYNLNFAFYLPPQLPPSISSAARNISTREYVVLPLLLPSHKIHFESLHGGFPAQRKNYFFPCLLPDLAIKVAQYLPQVAIWFATHPVRQPREEEPSFGIGDYFTFFSTVQGFLANNSAPLARFIK